MTVIDEKVRTYGTKPVIEYTLWSDTTPESLEITGVGIGRPGTEIAVGSFLLTPSARYIYGENQSFVQLSW